MTKKIDSSLKNFRFTPIYSVGMTGHDSVDYGSGRAGV